MSRGETGTKLGFSGPDREGSVQGRAGQGRVLNSRFRPAAARTLSQVLTDLLANCEEAGFCGIDAVACVST